MWFRRRKKQGLIYFRAYYIDEFANIWAARLMVQMLDLMMQLAIEKHHSHNTNEKFLQYFYEYKRKELLGKKFPSKTTKLCMVGLRIFKKRMQDNIDIKNASVPQLEEGTV